MVVGRTFSFWEPYFQRLLVADSEPFLFDKSSSPAIAPRNSVSYDSQRCFVSKNVGFPVFLPSFDPGCTTPGMHLLFRRILAGSWFKLEPPPFGCHPFGKKPSNIPPLEIAGLINYGLLLSMGFP